MSQTPELPAPVRPWADQLAGSRIREVANAGMGRPGIYELWFGESDSVTPAFVGEAAAKALAEGKTFYTPNRGIPPLREAIARYLSNLRGLAIDAERVTVTSSGMSAIMLTLQALVDPGDNVVIATPLWPNAADATSMLGAEPRRVSLDPGPAGWTLDLDKLFAACDGRTRAILLNSPGNPTGWMMPAEQIAAVLGFCRRRRIWVLADEVYERIVYDRPYAPSFLDIATPDDPVISMNSFSKSWAMTGWRLGWVVAPPGLGPLLGKINEFNVSGANTFAMWGGIAAVERGEGFTQAFVDQCRLNRDLAVQRLAAMPRVRIRAPEAAFYCFFEVDGMTQSIEFAKEMLAKTNVGLAPGVAFGPEGEGWLRMCFAISTARLSEALDRMQPMLS